MDCHFAEYPLCCTLKVKFSSHCTSLCNGRAAFSQPRTLYTLDCRVGRQSHLPPQFLAGTDDAHPIHARVLFCTPCIRVTLDYIPSTLMGNDDDWSGGAYRSWLGGGSQNLLESILGMAAMSWDNEICSRVRAADHLGCRDPKIRTLVSASGSFWAT